MNVFFRTDASVRIGTGHVIRCLTLADELSQIDANISFICREEKGNLIELIEQKGYRVYRFPADTDLESDKKLTQKILEKQTIPIDWLILDHYAIDYKWEERLRPCTKKIMVIDDLFDRQHDCDILLDQNYSLKENRYHSLLPDHCIQLLGPEYALIRPQFRKTRKYLHERNGTVKRIFVLIGGSDPENETCKAIRATQMLNRTDIIIDIVIGASNPYRNEIETLVSQIPNINSHINVNNIAELMNAADLSIGGGGSATWERCCLGLPSISIIITENQRDISESLEKNGVIINLGWHEGVTEIRIKEAVEDLINNSEKRKNMSLKGREMVDGKGDKKVAKVIFNLV